MLEGHEAEVLARLDDAQQQVVAQHGQQLAAAASTPSLPEFERTVKRLIDTVRHDRGLGP
jgi:hypothetical protein